MKSSSRSICTYLALSLTYLALFLGVQSWAQQVDELAMTMTSTVHVDVNGNAHMEATINFNPPRMYDRIRQRYPNLYVAFRDLRSNRAGYEFKRGSLKITPDDAERTISISGDVLGAAVSKEGQWVIGLASNEHLSSQEPTRISTATGSSSMMLTTSYILPAKALNVHFDREAHVITYSLPKPPPVPGTPDVDVSVRYKQRVMSAVYKIYGDPAAMEGAYWLAKTILVNTGKAPIYDLKIRYELGEYAETSVPQRYSMVAPGGAVVDIYYPIIRSKVAEMRTTTPIQLIIHYDYRDGAGKSYSGELAKRLEILGINQFDFSNLNNDDRTDSWFDAFNNAPLLAAYVTKIDDPVKQFAGYVSHKAGGAPAASDDESAIRWLMAAYETELANDIVYSTPSGFLTPDMALGQDIKYPRDVFRDKSGTCIDLAITFAALAEAVGLKSYLMVVPGHTFPVILLPKSNTPFPVEATGLRGGNDRLSFKQAAEAGRDELVKFHNDGLYYFVDVEKEWNIDRVPTPELSPLGTDFLAKSGIHPPDEIVAGAFTGGGAGGGGKSRNGALAGSVGPSNQAARNYLVVHDHGLGNLAYFCVGTLTVSGDSVAFQAHKSNDGRLDHFVVKKSDIVEVRKNKLPLGQNGFLLEAFHIKLRNGANFNFARVNQQGQGLSANDVLMDLTE